jgi:hypothetical protein
VVIEAIYDNGVLRPLTPVPFADQERVTLTVVGSEEELFDRDYYGPPTVSDKPVPTHEEIRAMLSTIKGSMDDAIDESRGEW